MVEAAIETKISQAEFHLEKLRTPESDLAAASHFSALLACVRSVVMYVHEWQIAEGRATSKNDWSRINAWEARLDPVDFAVWRALVELRNADIHDAPVVPARVIHDDYFGDWFGHDYFADWFGARVVLQVPHPSTGVPLDVIEIAERSIRIVKALLGTYHTL